MSKRSKDDESEYLGSYSVVGNRDRRRVRRDQSDGIDDDDPFVPLAEKDHRGFAIVAAACVIITSFLIYMGVMLWPWI